METPTFIMVISAVLILFAAMFFIVKSGRLTLYILALDGILVQAEPIFNSVAGYDFHAIMTQRQQGWLILVMTILAAIARKRRELTRKGGRDGAPYP